MNKEENGHTKKSIVVPVVASISSLAVLVVAVVIFLVLKKKKAAKVEGINQSVNKFKIKCEYSNITRIVPCNLRAKTIIYESIT